MIQDTDGETKTSSRSDALLMLSTTPSPTCTKSADWLHTLLALTKDSWCQQAAEHNNKITVCKF